MLRPSIGALWRLTVARPNSDRMIAQSGLSDIDREKRTATRPVIISQMPAAEASVAAIEVPSAAPCAPNAGIGPKPRIKRLAFSNERKRSRPPVELD